MAFNNETADALEPAKGADATLAADLVVLTVPQADKLAILDKLKLVPRIEKLLTWSSSTANALTGVASAKDGAKK